MNFALSDGDSYYTLPGFRASLSWYALYRTRDTLIVAMGSVSSIAGNIWWINFGKSAMVWHFSEIKMILVNICKVE